MKKQAPSSQALSQTKKGLAEWLKTYGSQIDDGYRDLLASADRTYALSSPTYANGGELLSEMGLLQSGYQSYLSGQAYATRQAAQDKAKIHRQKAITQGYKDYLDSYDSRRKSYMKTALSAIKSLGTTNLNEAYQAAVAEGLGHEDALHLAELGIASNTDSQDKKKQTLLTKLISYRFSKYDGTKFAMQYGFSKEEAAKLAELAEYFSKSLDYGFTGKTYENYLKEYQQQNQS